MSHAPTDAVSLTVGSNGFVIDFGCDQEMTEHIFSPHGHYFSIGGDKKSVNDIKNLGALVSYYRNLHCVYEYGYSSMFNPSFDADYVVTKFEFLLAQECFQDDCSTESRKIIMSAVIDK
ncbi:MAG: hypothetical protein LBD53_00520, partial [Tannerella sp.]|nr:hypothetical protein [Tannerella sp.]